jgi:transposase-like protein
MKSIDRFEKHQYIGNDTKRSFTRAIEFVDHFYQQKGQESCLKYIVLDSGCGRGLSSIKLAKQYPDLPVIGVDRSRRRLLTNKYYTPTFGSSDPKDQPGNRLKFFLKYKGIKSSLSNDTIVVEKHDYNEEGEESGDYDDYDDDDDQGKNVELNTGESSLFAEVENLPNLLLLHCELADFWKLMYYDSNLIVKKHFMLHPNPYPKIKNLKKRWHG